MRVPYYLTSERTTIFFQNLYEYYESGEYCDLTITVAKQSFPCHRIVLASSSQYFSALLSHSFKENSQEKIELKNIASDTFQMILNFIYSGTITLEENNVQQLLVASDMFHLVDLIQFCCHFLSMSINIQNVIDVWILADEYNFSTLKQETEYYMLKHFNNVIGQENFRTIPKHLLQNLVSNDDLTVQCENDVLEAILKWCLAGDYERLNDLYELFDNVRFTYLSNEYVQKTIESVLNSMSEIDKLHFIKYINDYVKSFHNGSLLLNESTTLDFTEINNETANQQVNVSTKDISIDYVHTQLTSLIQRLIDHKVKELFPSDLNNNFMLNNTTLPRRGIRRSLLMFGGYGTIDFHPDNNPSLFDIGFKIRLNNEMTTLEFDSIDSMKDARMHHQTVVLNDLVYVVGGEDGDCMIYNSMEHYNIIEKRWYQSPSMLEPRCNFGLCVIFNRFLYAIGGQIGADINSTIEIYDSSTSQWTKSTCSLTSARYAFACTELNGLIYCFGGSDLFDIPLKTTEIINPTTNRTHLCTEMNEGRAYCTCCVFNEEIYVFGGINDNRDGLRSVEVYKHWEDKWYTVPSMYYPRVSPCVACLGQYLFVFGGRTGISSNSTILKSVECYDTERKLWTRINDLPINVFGASAAVC
ncbi:unnamed protein product [Didymodactylos carnosus]|uniref:BTB domain-containing protein n=1 Tax=Didymodactylos carnosus TaxID=1234261 RepID=A0A813YIB4_9BILA|nr:unnamed protein product [Didymodactylos carnosus]CAF1091019.1 unnamed protein product [Didymodactylos carnosus]CAF3670235.1 unnamed protein product [Didymodactylos carnosus]CAF3852645.1 unnamed protein product [Didymodactylos carnosus]